MYVCMLLVVGWLRGCGIFGGVRKGRGGGGGGGGGGIKEGGNQGEREYLGDKVMD